MSRSRILLAAGCLGVALVVGVHPSAAQDFMTSLERINGKPAAEFWKQEK